MSGTKWVRAVVPVLGLRRHQTAELADSPYLTAVLDKGWLETVTKTEAKKAADAGTVAPVDPAVTTRPGE